MGENTKIEWANHTFNPWRGCAKVSAGCDNCYAERGSKRNPGVLGVWGEDGTRVVASESYWRLPIQWNTRAEAAGERHRVFCASLADVFEDRPELVSPRERLFDTIEATQHLDWLLLTKRPQHVCTILDDLDRVLPSNVWLGTSVEDQPTADKRVPDLINVRGLHAVLFVSYEPALGAVDFSRFVECTCSGHQGAVPWHEPDCTLYGRGVDWIIVGGESGPGARSFALQWARDTIRQCRESGVSCFVKQLGSRPSVLPTNDGGTGYYHALVDRNGRDISEWPEDLKVREIPAITTDELEAV
jgi:protein gp37